MSDQHLRDALHDLAQQWGDDGDVRRRMDRKLRARRRRRRAVAAVVVAATIAAVVGVASSLDGSSDDRTVVVGPDPQPDDRADPDPGVSDPDDPEPGADDPIDPGPVTGDDPLGLAAGVVSVGVTTWDPDRILWPVDDPELAEEVVARLLGAQDDDAVPEPEHGDRALLVLELVDGEQLAVGIELRSGWVEPRHSIGAELAERLAAGLDEAVSPPWQEVDLADDSFLSSAVRDAGGPFASPEAALDAIVGVFMDRRELPEMETYDGRLVERDPSGQGAVAVVRHRGAPDDAARGFDYRLELGRVGEAEWVVDDATLRWLCRRSTASPPDYSCL